MAVNVAPDGADDAITLLEDGEYTFAAADFGFSDNDGNTLLAVKIAALPAAGHLFVNGVAVNTDDLIAIADIVSGSFKYIPDPDGYGAAHASFAFQVQDDGGTAGGGVDLDPSSNTMTINVSAVADTPIVMPAMTAIDVYEDGIGGSAQASFQVTTHRRRSGRDRRHGDARDLRDRHLLGAEYRADDDCLSAQQQSRRGAVAGRGPGVDRHVQGDLERRYRAEDHHCDDPRIRRCADRRRRRQQRTRRHPRSRNDRRQGRQRHHSRRSCRRHADRRRRQRPLHARGLCAAVDHRGERHRIGDRYDHLHDHPVA